MSPLEWVSTLLMVIAAAFFLAGTVGVLRFPDTHSRLHAITKADNLGLGLLVAALIVQAETVPVALKLVLAWTLALVASAASCYLIASATFVGSKPRNAGEGEADA
jgi:multicomponent Na+:H+ antiporter subunit G